MIDWKKRAEMSAKTEKLMEKVPKIKVESEHIAKQTSKEMATQVKEALLDYDVRNYDSFGFQCPLFKFQCIFKSKDATILHFYLIKRLMRPEIYEEIVKFIRERVKHKAHALEADEFRDIPGIEPVLDIIVYGPRLKIGDKRWWMRLGEQIKEHLMRKYY